MFTATTGNNKIKMFFQQIHRYYYFYENLLKKT